MRLLFLSVLLISINSHAQDGSDISYIPASKIDHSILGKPAQLDFYHRSFHGAHLDTISIMIYKAEIQFREHREDDGHNNWFKDQYLESIDVFNGEKIRIVEFVIDRITQDSFLVTCHLQGYVNNNPVGVLKTEKTWLDKKTVVEVLVQQRLK